jgi:hypothetical protein
MLWENKCIARVLYKNICGYMWFLHTIGYVLLVKRFGVFERALFVVMGEYI